MSKSSFEAIAPEMLEVARGDRPADLLLRNARIINVFSGDIEEGAVAICGSRIAGVGEYEEAVRTVDVRGSYVGPGFIDAHMHVESTMMPPSEFVRIAVPHGTTGVVLDPHEIANVLGISGIRYVMDDARDLPINALFAISSCVPASPLETSGATLEADDLAPLFDDPRVVALAEMMNFPGVVRGVPGVLAKVELGLSRRMVDGHAPGLSGKALQAYVAAGITSDHECTTLAEAQEKLRLGMRVFIREGSAAHNLEALLPAVTSANRTRFCFCTDDRHPADLVHEGHVDHVVREAIRRGMDPVTAIMLASTNVAQHYRQRDLGAVAPGYFADLVIFDDLHDLRPRQVYYHGTLVAENGNFIPAAGGDRMAAAQAASIVGDHCGESQPGVVSIPVKRAGRSIRVIGMNPTQLVTRELIMTPLVRDHCHVADPMRDLLKMAVVERHRGTGNVGLGFVHGFGLRTGALASTVGHDSHNISVVGTNDGDMLVAVQALARAGGGQCVVQDGQVLALLPLPIAGLMSDQPIEVLVEQQRRLHEASRAIGCPIPDPFMPLSFMSLPVIPKLKLTDLGLVDVDLFEVVELEA